MGNFYTNITVLGHGATDCVKILNDLGRDAYVVEVNECSVVYDRECDEQKEEVLAALSEHFATCLDTITFGVLNHDDDILWFQLYDRSDLVAEYANRYGPRTNILALCRTLSKSRDFLTVWWLLHRPFLFQVSRHYRLVKHFGLPEASVSSGYTYISRGDTPIGVSEENIIRVLATGY